MPTDDPDHWWLVSKLLHPSITCHQMILAKVSLWIRLPPWTISVPHQQSFGVGVHSDLHWARVLEHFGLHRTWVVALPESLVHSQTWIVCCWGFNFGHWAVGVSLPQQDFIKLETEGVQWQYRHYSISLLVEPLKWVMTFPGSSCLKKDLLLVIQIVVFDVGLEGGFSDVLTLVVTHLLIGIVILLHWWYPGH